MKKSLVESPCSYSLTSRICWRLPQLRRLPRDWTYTQSGTESGRSSLVQLFQEREYRWGSGEGLLCQQAICKDCWSAGWGWTGCLSDEGQHSQSLAAHNMGGLRVLGPAQREGRAVFPWDPSIPGKGESNCPPTQEPLAGPDEDIDFF